MPNVARMRRKVVPYTFVVPLMIVLAFVNFYPILWSLRLSLSVWPVEKFMEGPTFAGFVNYQKLWTSERLWGSVSFMVFYVITSVTLVFFIGMIVALLLDSKMPVRGVVRSVVMLPIAMAPLIIALTWRHLFDSDFGVINFVLRPLGVGSIVWLSTLPWAQISIVIVEVWHHVPFLAIVLLAGLQAIPDEYYEAARIDGGARHQVFWSITMPLLRPALLVGAVILTTNAVRMFDLSYALTSGGPYASTETLTYFAFVQAFQAFDLPLASAVGWCVFGLNLIITLIYLKFLYVKVEV